MKVTVCHSAATKQTVISLSRNLVSAASDITDECDVRLEGVEGRKMKRGVSHRLHKCNYVTVSWLQRIGKCRG